MKHTMQFSVGDEVANVPHDEMDEFNAVAKQNNVTPEPIFSYRVSGKDMEPQEVEVPKSQYEEFAKVAADNGAKIEPLRRLVFANGAERQFTGPELRKFMSGEYRTSPDYQSDRDEIAAKVRAKIGDDPQYTDYMKAQDPKSLAESVEGLKESFKGAAYMARKTVLPYVRAFLTAPMRLMGQAMASGVPMTPSITGGGVTFNPPKESGEAFKEIANGIEGAVAPSKEEEAWASENGLSTVGKVEETAQGIGAFASALHSIGPLAGNILMSATAGNDAYINRYDEQIQLGKSPEEASEAAARDGAIVTLGTAAMGAMPVSRVLKFGKAAPVIDATKGEIRNYSDLLRQAVDGNIKNWLINSGVATVEAAAISGGEAYLAKLSDFKAHGRELDGNAHLEALWDGAKEATETAGIVALMGGMQYGDYRRAIRDGVAREAKAASETTETRLMWGRIFPEGTEAVIRKRLAGENISRGDIHRAGYPEMSQAERNAIGDALVQDVAEFIRRNRQPRPAQIPEKTLSGQPEAAKPVIEAKIDPHGPNFNPETGSEAPVGAEKPVQPPEVAANLTQERAAGVNPTNDTPPAPSAPTPVPVRPTASASEAAPKKTAVEEYEGRLGAKTEDGRPVAPFTPGLRNGVGSSKDFRDKRLAEMGTDFEHATDEQLQQITNEKNEIEKRHNKIEKDWYASLPDGTTVYPGEGQAGGAIMKVDGKWYNLTSEGTLDHQQLDHNGKPIGKPYRVEHDIGSITTPIPESSRVELPKSNGKSKTESTARDVLFEPFDYKMNNLPTGTIVEDVDGKRYTHDKHGAWIGEDGKAVISDQAFRDGYAVVGKEESNVNPVADVPDDAAKPVIEAKIDPEGPDFPSETGVEAPVGAEKPVQPPEVAANLTQERAAGVNPTNDTPPAPSAPTPVSVRPTASASKDVPDLTDGRGKIYRKDYPLKFPRQIAAETDDPKVMMKALDDAEAMAQNAHPHDEFDRAVKLTPKGRGGSGVPPHVDTEDPIEARWSTIEAVIDNPMADEAVLKRVIGKGKHLSILERIERRIENGEYYKEVSSERVRELLDEPFKKKEVQQINPVADVPDEAAAKFLTPKGALKDGYVGAKPGETIKVGDFKYTVTSRDEENGTLTVTNPKTGGVYEINEQGEVKEVTNGQSGSGSPESAGARAQETARVEAAQGNGEAGTDGIQGQADGGAPGAKGGGTDVGGVKVSKTVTDVKPANTKSDPKKVAKVAEKFNLHLTKAETEKMSRSKNGINTNLMKTYHDPDGHLVATDGRILISTTHGFDKAKADADKASGRTYPNWRHVIPAYDTLSNRSQVNPKTIIAVAKEATKLARDTGNNPNNVYVVVEVGDTSCLLAAKYAEKMAEAMDAAGMTELATDARENYPVIAHDKTTDIVTMPVRMTEADDNDIVIDAQTGRLVLAPKFDRDVKTGRLKEEDDLDRRILDRKSYRMGMMTSIETSLAYRDILDVRAGKVSADDAARKQLAKTNFQNESDREPAIKNLAERYAKFAAIKDDAELMDALHDEFRSYKRADNDAWKRNENDIARLEKHVAAVKRIEELLDAEPEQPVHAEKPVEKPTEVAAPVKDAAYTKWLHGLPDTPERRAEYEKSHKAEDNSTVENRAQTSDYHDATDIKRKYVDHVQFSNPLVGKNGAKLVSYSWKNKKEEYVDNQGEDRVRKVSDWEESLKNEDTNRDIVHHFDIVDADGNLHTVSLGTAAKMLGLDVGKVRGEALAQMRKAVKLSDISDEQRKSVERVLKRSSSLNGSVGMPFYKDGDSVAVMRDGSIRIMGPRGKSDGVYDRWCWSVVTIDKNGKVNESRLAAKPNTKGFEIEIEDISLKAEATATADKPQGDRQLPTETAGGEKSASKENAKPQKLEPEQASRTPEEVAAAKKQFVEDVYAHYQEEGSVRAGAGSIARIEHEEAISRVQDELKSETDAMEKARDAGTQAEFDKHSDRVEELKDALKVLNGMKDDVDDIDVADNKSESHASLRKLLKEINDVSPIPNYEDIGPYSRRDAKRSGVKIIDDANDDIDDTIGRIEKFGRDFEEDDDLVFDAAERYLDKEFEFSKDVYDKLTDGDRKYLDKLVREAAEAKKEVIETIYNDDQVPTALSKKFVEAHEAIGAFEESARKYHGLMRDDDGRAVLYTEKAHATEMAADAVSSVAKALAAKNRESGKAAMARMRLAVNNGGDFPNRKAVNAIAKELPEEMRKAFVKNMNEWRKWAEERADDVRYHVSRLSTSLIDPDFTAWAAKQGVKPDAKQRQTYDRIQSEKSVKMLRRFIPNVKVEFADRPKDVNADPEVRASRVHDPELIRSLENGKTVKVFRAMQMIDGKLYPPMAAKVQGKMVDPIELGVWEKADERPDLIKNGKFTLNKANGASIQAAYNPYLHTSRSPLNDQFSSAYKRPNLVTVEVEVPESELTSGYKAEGAKDAVGEMTWHSGPVSSKLPPEKSRRVILSRYDKPIRIVPDSEVADRVAEMLRGENITVPSNTVTPSLLNELVKHGVSVDTTPTDIRYLHDSATGAVVGTYDRSTNKVTLMPGANIETVMHEMGGHALWQYAEQHPELKLKEKLAAYADEAPQELKDAIAADYAADGLSPEALLDEIFSGRFGREKSGKVADALRREAGRKWYQKVWDAIKGAWRAVVSRFGGNKVDTDALDGMTPDEAVEYMAAQMVAGKTLGRVEPSSRAAESAPTAKDTPYITQKASGGKVHELLQSYLARRDDANSAGEVRKSVGGEPAGNAEAELLSLARENGVHLGGVEEVRAKVSGEPFADGQVDKHGMETISVKRDGDKVVKLRIADNSTDHENEKVAYHNELFPDTKYTIRGFAEDANGDPVTVLEQRYVEFEPNSGERARKALLDELRERFGSAEMRGNEIHAGGWAIDDLKDANVGIDAKTGKPAVIDCIIHRVDDLPKNLRWESDKSGGEVRYLRGGFPSRAPAAKPVFDDPQSKAKNTREMFQDSRIKVRDFERKVGITDKAKSAYHAADRKNGLIEHQFDKLERDFVAPILRSLAEQGIDPATFDRYLVAEHAAERNAVVASRGGGQGASMTDAEAQQFLDDLRARGEYDRYHAIGEKVWAMNQEALDRALSSGRISQQYHDQLTNQWSHYVPLRFDMENEELDTFNRSIGGWRKDEYATAKGHTAEEDSPLAFSFMQAEQSIKAANENIVRQKVAENFETAAKRGFNAGKIYKGRQMKKTWAFDVGKDVITADEGFNERDRDDLIFFKRDGDLYAVVVNPGKHGGGIDYARAITGKNMPQLGAFWRGVRSFTQWKARMRTSLVPTFIGRNFKNDTFETQRHLDMDFGVVEGKKIMASVVKWEAKNAPAVMAYAKDGRLTGGYVQEYVENGGLIGGGVASNYADQVKRIRKDIGYYSKHSLAVSAFRAAMKGIQVLNELAENSTRIGVYSALRERGMSVEDAISWARDNTGNFNRKGTKSDYTNSLWMFSNAAVQGHARDLHGYKNAAEHGAGRLASNLLQTAMVGTTLALLAHYFGNDEEREKAGASNARNETEYAKQTQMSVPVGGGKKAQWGMRGLAASEIYAARKIAEVVLGDTDAGDAAVELAKYAGDQLTSVVGGNGLDSPSKAAQTVSPAHTDMLVQMALGKDYKDDDLYRRKFNEYDPDSWNGSRKTPEIYVKVAQALNAITGGNEHRKGKVDLAPETIKLFAEELGGGVMRDIDTAYQAVKGAVDAAKGDAPDDLVGSIPFVRDTVRKYPSVSGRFWEAYDRYKTDKNEYDGTTDAGRKRELVKEHPYLRKVDGKTEIDRLFKIHQVLQEHLDGFMRVDGKKREHEYTPKQKSEFRDKMRRVEAQILKLLGD